MAGGYPVESGEGAETLPRYLGGEVPLGRRLSGEGPRGVARLLRLLGGARVEPSDDKTHRVDFRHNKLADSKGAELPERENGAESRVSARYERLEAMAPTTRFPSSGRRGRRREVHQ